MINIKINSVLIPNMNKKLEYLEWKLKKLNNFGKSNSVRSSMFGLKLKLKPYSQLGDDKTLNMSIQHTNIVYNSEDVQFLNVHSRY